VVVRQEGREPGKADILSYLTARVAKWQVPDDAVFVEALPMTATGKISKKDLREQFRNHYSCENTIRVLGDAASNCSEGTEMVSGR
jgi:acyl-CoA synthetase (AMP-forming)/AMP-acid ligase II